MIPTGSDTWYDGYTYNPPPLLREKLEKEYGICLRDEFHDSIEMFTEYLIYSSPTTNRKIMKELFVCEDKSVNLLFRERYTNAYIHL